MQTATVEEVGIWLRENRCPMTLFELYHEWKVNHEVCSPLLEGAAALSANDSDEFVGVGSGKDSLRADSMEQAVVDVLFEFGKQCGGAAIQCAAAKALSRLSLNDGGSGEYYHLPCPSFRAKDTVCSGRRAIRTTDAPLEKEMDEEDILGVSFRAKLQQSEEGLAKVTSILTESLNTLVHIVDPMRKDVLIPLISLPATLSGKSAGKAAARRMLLTLYTRPSHENRIEVAKAWVESLKHVPFSVLEHDIVPEMYILVNAKASERRILALNCMEYVSPLLGGDPVLRRSICQGLLKPLSEDESKTVRCHVVYCLVELWPQVTECGGNKEEESDEWWCGSSFDECFYYYLELILHLILHDASDTVRRRALQGFRDEVLPKCVSHRMLLTRVSPVILSCIEREMAVSVVTHSPLQNTATRSAIPALASGEKLGALEATSSRNSLILVSLIHDVLHYICVDDTAGYRVVAPSVFDAYLYVLLPSVYALVVTSREHEALNSVICALASALATIMPALRMVDWKCLRRLLEVSLKEEFGGGGGNDSRGAMVVSHCDDWRRRQLCFFFAFLTSVAGMYDPSIENTTQSSAITSDAAALLLHMVTAGADEEEERTKQAVTGADASARLDACASSLSCFMVRGDEAEAVSSVLWSFTKSLEERQRMLAVALVEHISSLSMDDKVRSLHLWPPLLVLMNDTTYEVKESAVKAAVSMVTYISTPVEQERVLQAALATVEEAGCPSHLSATFLRHWCSLMRVMPAEPRESFMYPALATMIDQLVETFRRRERGVPEKEGSIRRVSDGDVEETLQALLAVLAAIPHCAVVTPQPVKKYLIPGIRLLASVSSLSVTYRSQMLTIANEYSALLDPNRGGVHGASSFLHRVRNELKKHI